MEHMNEYTVCVITKGRTTNPRTINLFSDLPFVSLHIFAFDDDERKFYAERYPSATVHVQKYTQHGVAGARQHALEYLRESGTNHGVISDDDIAHILRNMPYGVKSMYVKDPDRYYEMFEKLRQLNETLAIVSVVWSEPFAKRLHARCVLNWKLSSVFVMYNIELIPDSVNYDFEMKMFEDNDFHLQVLSSGQQTGCYGGYLLDSKFGELIKGGVSVEYANAQLMDSLIERMQQKWSSASNAVGESIFSVKPSPVVYKYFNFAHRPMKRWIKDVLKMPVGYVPVDHAWINDVKTNPRRKTDKMKEKSPRAQRAKTANLGRLAALKQQLEIPKVVCLCGSTKFVDVFQKMNEEETLAGNIVLSIGSSLREVKWDQVPKFVVEKIKTDLDELHKRKIDLADEILVINVDGYIGESTTSEIEYAKSTNKPVRYLVHADGDDTVPLGSASVMNRVETDKLADGGYAPDQPLLPGVEPNDETIDETESETTTDD